MPQQSSAPVAAVVALSSALDALLGALASGSAANLFASEAGLAGAIADVSRIGRIAEDDRPQLRSELLRARLALARCRATGNAMTSVVDGCLTARGLSNTYDRAGGVTIERAARPVRVRW